MKAAVLDGRIFVPGGLTGVGQSTARTDVYEPRTDTWRTVAPLPVGLNHHATAPLDGRVVVVGGNEDIRDPPGREVFAYDPTVDAWDAMTPLPEGRWGHEALVHEGRMYVLGGVTRDDAAIDTLVFDPASEQWERRAPIPTRREHVAASILDGELVVVSGRWDDSNRATVEAYDPAADSWRGLAPIPTARSGSGAAVIDDRLHVVGGEDPSTVAGWATDVHEVYHPGSDIWHDAPPAPLPVHGVSVVAHGDRLYAIGGAWRQGPWSVTAWSDRTFVYDPAAGGSIG